MMEYKGYIGKVEIDDEVGVLYGEVINVRDVITFEGTSVEEVQQAFHESVDDYLEFYIKTYPDRKGVTNELLKLKKGDELILHDVWGVIQYKKEGVFIAGGAGVTPFIAILRQLHSKNEMGENKLIFANKTKKDIFLKEEFTEMLGDNFINILSDEETDEYAHGFVTKDFLEKLPDFVGSNTR